MVLESGYCGTSFCLSRMKYSFVHDSSKIRHPEIGAGGGEARGRC